MRYSFIIIWCLFSLLLSTRESYAYLKVSGRDILDNQDQKILLRGMGLGGWLVPEGYQLHIPDFGSPSAIEKMIRDLIGSTDTQEFYRLYQQNYVREVDIQKIASWGFNSIRLPFNYRMLSPENQPGVYLEEGFQVIDQLLQWCEKYQLYLILDMHCAPGGQNAGNISDSDGIEARLWTEVTNQDRTVAIWRKIAERYVKAEWIGGYDLINEPVLPSGYSSTQLRSLYMRITRAIREVDPDHIVFIEGNWYATDFTSLTPPFDLKLVYSFHKYWDETSTASIQKYMQIRSQYNLPLWMGESGENSNTWFNACVQVMEENNIGWCWWTHKKIQTTTSPYSSPISPNYQRILDYWNKKASKPSQEFARQALFQMANNLAIEKCDFLPDVVDALFRSDFNSKTLPYKEQHLPGLIQAIDYDLGNVLVAYSDKDYQNAPGPSSGGPWNRGWRYRNDGVDIESCQDTSGAIFNVGWIEDGEWLLYTVSIAEAGIYSVECRVASSGNTGRFRLFLDGQVVSNEISVPNTGGWQNWKSVTATTFSLPAGLHRLKIAFTKGNFNLNYLSFTLKSSSVSEGSQIQSPVKSLSLAQNYPNPFNQSTEITVFSSKTEVVSLNIYNLQGKLVRKIFKGNLSSGKNLFLWDGTDDFAKPVSSGIYFCFLESERYRESRRLVLQR